jgi:pantetheine-phosphate adenylyltransferase
MSSGDRPLPTTFESALVELSLPPATSSMPQVLLNDTILERAVKEVTKRLHVHVLGADASTARSVAYVSAIYERLWEEMATRDRHELQCIVTCEDTSAAEAVGETEGGGGERFPDRSHLYLEPTLQAVYSCPSPSPGMLATATADEEKSSFLAARNAERAAVGLPAVLGVACAPLPLDAHGRAAGGELFFFDDADSVAQPLPAPCRRIALGGTFDRLHNGHRKLLCLASRSSSHSLIVGIMGDPMLRSKKGADRIQPFALRRRAVEDFLRVVRPAGFAGVELVELQDPYGPTIVDPTVDGIVVSSETLAGAIKINSLRAEKGMQPLRVGVVRRSQAATLSSTFLRAREA